MFLLEPRKAQKMSSDAIFKSAQLPHRPSNQHGLLVIHKYIPGDEREQGRFCLDD